MYKSIRENISNYLFEPINPETSAVFRICVGAIYVCLFFAMSSSWWPFFSDNGILSMHSVKTLEPMAKWTIFYWLPDTQFAYYSFFVLAVVAAICFLVGFYTRIATIILYFTQISMIHRNSLALDGEDFLLCIFMFYAVFAELGAGWSVDQWLRRRRGKLTKNKITAWPIRMMQITMILVYWLGLHAKLIDEPNWSNGDFMYYLLTNPYFSRWDWSPLIYSAWLSKVLTYTPLIIEACLPVAICFKRFRVPAVTIAILFHFSIAILIRNLWFFSAVTISGFLLFLPYSAWQVLPSVE